jgi:peptidyl-prolyl cis-trans isomerase D
MLKFLRHKKTAKKIWIGLAFIIVPAFVLWGSGSLIRSKQEETFAGIMFGRKVSLLEFRDAYDAERVSAIIQYGDKLPEVEQQLNLEASAWERLMLLHEAKRRKINANNKEVIAFLQKLPFFQHEGKFDKRIYEETVQYAFRTLPRVFEEQTRQNLILSKLFKQVTEQVGVTDEEVKKEYEKANEEFSVFYIVSVPDDFAKDVSALEENIKDYFTKNPLVFKQPISFNMDYIEVESEQKINEAVKRLNKKEGLQQIAQALNLSLKETGMFSQTDPIPGIGWSAGILNLISRLRVGQLTPPIKMDKNYYVLELKERKESSIPDFEKVKDKAREMYIEDVSVKKAREKIEEGLKQLKEVFQQDPQQVDFAKTAKEYGLKFDSTDFFKYGSYIEGIGASDQLWTAAKLLKEDEFSNILTMPSGFFIIKVKDRVAIDEEEFEAEKTEFKQKLLTQKKQISFARFVDDLKRKAQ